MKIKITSLIPVLFALLLAQRGISQDGLDKKINNISGKVDKIVITSDGKEHVFEGDEANQLFKKMKEDSIENFVWTTTDDDNNKKKIVVIKTDGETETLNIDTNDDAIVIQTEKDIDSIEDGITKNVKVEIEDGNKKVTVTTKENGKEKTEVYEGKEADEFMEKMKSENGDIDIQINSEKDGKKVKKIIIKTEKEENSN